MLTRKPLRIAIAIAILVGAAGARAPVPEKARQATTPDATVLGRLQSVPLHDVTSQPRTPGPLLPPTIGQCAPTASRVAGPDRFAPRAAAAHRVPFRHPSRDGASVQALPCGDRTRPPRAGAAHTTLCLVGVMMMLTLLGLWWDSSPQGVSPKALVAKLFIHSTHSYPTEWAIDKLKGRWPELEQYRKQIIEGANTEMHNDEENAKGTKYGINLVEKAKEREGTNAGCNEPEGYWKDCLDAYLAGDKPKAYFLLGILLHMIQDMGVPAHACKAEHEGRIVHLKWDNFEQMGTFNWKPSFDNIPPEQENPEPSDYYAVSKDLTLQDVCDFLEIKRVKGKEPPPRWDINAFSKTWLFANHRETALLSRRQGCTCHVTMWALSNYPKTPVVLM